MPFPVLFLLNKICLNQLLIDHTEMHQILVLMLKVLITEAMMIDESTYPIQYQLSYSNKHEHHVTISL